MSTAVLNVDCCNIAVSSFAIQSIGGSESPSIGRERERRATDKGVGEGISAILICISSTYGRVLQIQNRHMLNIITETLLTCMYNNYANFSLTKLRALCCH